MDPLMSIGVLCALALAITGGLHLLGVSVEPEREKRTYLFETEDGERYNPFGETPDSTGETPDTCLSCGAVNEPSYSFCSSCATRLPPKQQS